MTSGAHILAWIIVLFKSQHTDVDFREHKQNKLIVAVEFYQKYQFKEMLNFALSLSQDTEQKKSGNYFFLDD